MSPPAAITVNNVQKKYGSTIAVNQLSCTIEENSIVGLLGRNGAGKTTLMSMMTGQDRPTSGTLEAFGQPVFENTSGTTRMSFIRDNQRYPDEFTAAQAFKAASYFHAGWDEEFAQRLITMFELPMDIKIEKLSRGQNSTVGIIVGLASRAPITFLDEPYLGLDATNRKNFYRTLLEDYLENPRTYVISTHLIDEIDNVLEHVLVIDRGKLALSNNVEAVKDKYQSVSGPAGAVSEMISGIEILSEHSMGGLRSVLVPKQFDAALIRQAQERGLEIGPASLQDVVAALGVHQDQNTEDE